MSEQFYTILTNIGKAKIANAISLGSEVNLVRFVVGDSNGSYYNPTEEQTELRRKVWETNAISVVNDEKNPNWIKIEAIIPGDVGGFTVREVGIFDDKNEMIAIGKIAEIYKPISENGSTKDVIIRMIIEVSNASAVTIKVDPTVMIATKKDIEVVESKFKKITGDKNELVTKNKCNLVAAINEVATGLNTIELTGNKVTIEDTDNNFVSGTVEGALQELATKDKALDTRIGNNKTEVDEKLKEIKQSGSDFKDSVASAITAKGVSTSGTDNKQTFVNNIDSIIVRSPIADDEIGVVQWEDGSYKGFKEETYSKIPTPVEDRKLKSYFLAPHNQSGVFTARYVIDENWLLYCSGSGGYAIEAIVSKLNRQGDLFWQYQLTPNVLDLKIDSDKNVVALHGDTGTKVIQLTKLDASGKAMWVKPSPDGRARYLSIDKFGFIYVLGLAMDTGEKITMTKYDPTTGDIVKTKVYDLPERSYVMEYNAHNDIIVFSTASNIVKVGLDLEIIQIKKAGNASYTDLQLTDSGDIFIAQSNMIERYDSDLQKIWGFIGQGGSIAVNDLLETYTASNYDIYKFNPLGVNEYSFPAHRPSVFQFIKDNIVAYSTSSSGTPTTVSLFQDNFKVTKNILLETKYIEL